MAFKVGDRVNVAAVVTGVLFDGGTIELQAASGITAWVMPKDVAPAQAFGPDYCLGFNDGYDYGYNGDDAHTTYRFYQPGDFRAGWAAGYRHARAGIDAALLAEVEGGE